MRIAILYFLFLILSFVSNAQSKLDNALSSISSDLCNKLSEINKKKIVVLYVNDINKAPSVAGKYLADGISSNIVNAKMSFQVFDRDNLEGIADAKRLIAQGYIDASKAKELGDLLEVEVIVVGTYTVLSNSIKLSLKAISSDNGLLLASSMKDLPLDDDIGALLGINVGGNRNADRGFNAPLNSDESYNNPRTVNKECETKKTGDYCFTNSRRRTVRITLNPENPYKNGVGEFGIEMSVEPGQTQCVYGRYIQPYSYFITEGANENMRKGQIMFEQCKSKTFEIK